MSLAPAEVLPPVASVVSQTILTRDLPPGLLIAVSGRRSAEGRGVTTEPFRRTGCSCLLGAPGSAAGRHRRLWRVTGNTARPVCPQAPLLLPDHGPEVGKHEVTPAPPDRPGRATSSSSELSAPCRTPLERGEGRDHLKGADGCRI